MHEATTPEKRTQNGQANSTATFALQDTFVNAGVKIKEEQLQGRCYQSIMNSMSELKRKNGVFSGYVDNVVSGEFFRSKLGSLKDLLDSHIKSSGLSKQQMSNLHPESAALF